MKIPVAFITDENFIMQTGVAIYSLIKNKYPKTKYDVFIIMAECSDESKKKIQLVKGHDVQIHIVEASLNMYRDIKQISHIPISCLLKFNLCDLITEYDKILYLDGDVYVRGDLTELYQMDLKGNFMAGVPSLDMLHDNRKLINAGVLLFDAKKMRDNHMAEQLIKTRKKLGDRGSMDQQTFNMIMSDKIGFLPCIYNCISQKLLGVEGNNYPIDKLNQLYETSYKNRKEMVSKAIIIHYATNGKPWKYSYIACADEWYKCYQQSPYGGSKLKRKSAFQMHMQGIWRNIKKGGVKAIFIRIVWYINALRGKNDYNKWG